MRGLLRATLLLGLSLLAGGCFVHQEAYCPSGLIEEDGGGFFVDRDGGGFFVERDGGGYFVERDGGGFFIERDGGGFFIDRDLVNPRRQLTCRRGVPAPPPP